MVQKWEKELKDLLDAWFGRLGSFSYELSSSGSALVIMLFLALGLAYALVR